MRPLLVDLFCGAGGASMGLHRAGFDVVGVDHVPQPRYPFDFVQMDALEYPLDAAAAVWASSPCQRFSVATTAASRSGHPDLIEATRARLRDHGSPWIIENVPAAPLESPLALRGDMFGLGVIRSRRFESNVLLMSPEMPRAKPRLGEGYVCVAGNGMNRSRRGDPSTWTKPYPTDIASWRESMGIDWMVRWELVQAIPPAYAEYLGRQLIRYIERAA
tara:strand:+ start:7081 stop:7734 length:654 start_codon:yes stop_codon:yes gene_type:complete